MSEEHGWDENGNGDFSIQQEGYDDASDFSFWQLLVIMPIPPVVKLWLIIRFSAGELSLFDQGWLCLLLLIVVGFDICSISRSSTKAINSVCVERSFSMPSSYYSSRDSILYPMVDCFI